MSKTIYTGIYKITSPSGKIYIGQSINIVKRWNEHKLSKDNKKLHNSLRKYGSDSHIFEIIEECDTSSLNDRERFFQEKYNVIGVNGLNHKLTNTSDKSGKVLHGRWVTNGEDEKRVFGDDIDGWYSGRSDSYKMNSSISQKGKQKPVGHGDLVRDVLYGKGLIIERISLDGEYIEEGEYNIFISQGFNSSHIYNCCNGKEKNIRIVFLDIKIQKNKIL
jgi:group I intron endonuclease